jgi:hypothetical protein
VVGGGEARLWGCHRSHGRWAWPEGAGVGEGESGEQDRRVTDGAGVIVETEVEEGATGGGIVRRKKWLHNQLFVLPVAR